MSGVDADGARSAAVAGSAEPVGVVLAGGTGRRMGGAKPSALLAGRPLISYPLAALSAVLTNVAVVAKTGTVLPDLGGPVALWCEPDEPQHPLAGVVEALRRADGRAVVVLACDMPLVTAGLVGALAGREISEAAALVTRAGGRLQPLCARYEPQALALLQDFDPDGRAVEQVTALRHAVLEVDAEQLRNVNNAEQLADVEALLLGARPTQT